MTELRLDDWVSNGVLTDGDRVFARGLARLCGEADERVVLAMALCRRGPRFGHAAVDLSDPGRGIRASEVSAELEWPDATQWRAALQASPLVQPDGDECTPLVLDGARLYLRRYYEHEASLGQCLRARAAEPSLSLGVLPDSDPLLSGANVEQRLAINRTLEGALTVVTGGPGTGKTWLVVRALAAIVRQALTAGSKPPRIRLLAPTGKAAARLGEAVQAGLDALVLDESITDHIPREASTIHSALGVKGGHLARFWRTADNPLDADVVVVDESSMVDLALMRRLVEAVPGDARLILLGDAFQLASVEAGAVLADLCQAAPRHPGSGWARCVVNLLESRRFDGSGPIGRLARAVLDGDVAGTLAVLNGADAAVTWHEPAGDTLSATTLGTLRETSLPRRAALRAGDDDALLRAQAGFQILCAHRRGRLGVSGLNRAAADALGVPVAEQESWYPGRPILVCENDHAQRLYNGDIGTVAGPDEHGMVRVVFPTPTGPRPVAASRLPRAETVFALTIHKAQGSEYDHVMVVLPDGSRLCTRELLYTALTRARHRITLVASELAIRDALGQRVQRVTGLSDALGGHQLSTGSAMLRG